MYRRGLVATAVHPVRAQRRGTWPRLPYLRSRRSSARPLTASCPRSSGAVDACTTSTAAPGTPPPSPSTIVARSSATAAASRCYGRRARHAETGSGPATAAVTRSSPGYDARGGTRGGAAPWLGRSVAGAADLATRAPFRPPSGTPSFRARQPRPHIAGDRADVQGPTHRRARPAPRPAAAQLRRRCPQEQRLRHAEQAEFREPVRSQMHRP
jgi:hypothetical protein